MSRATVVVRHGNGTRDYVAGALSKGIESHQSSLQSKDNDASWKAKKSNWQDRQDTNATVAHAPVLVAESQDAKQGRPLSSAQVCSWY